MDKLLPCQALKKKKKLKKHTVTGKGRLPFTGSKNWVRHTWIPLRGEYSQKEPKKKKKHVPITNNDRWYLWLIIVLLFLFENGGRLHDESKIWSGLRPCTLMYCMRDPCQLLCVCIASLKKKKPFFPKIWSRLIPTTGNPLGPSIRDKTKPLQYIFSKIHWTRVRQSSPKISGINKSSW